MKFDFLNLRKTVDSLVGNVRDVRAKLETLRRQREEIAVAPATREDVIAILHARIDAGARSYLKNLDLVVAPVINKAHRGNAENFTHSILAAPESGQAPDLKCLESGLFFALNQQMKEAITRAVSQIEWPGSAVPLATRSKQLEKLDAEIAVLEKEEGELTQHANEAGITIG